MAFDLACRFVLTVVLSNNKRTIVLIVAYSIDTPCHHIYYILIIIFYD